MTETAPEYRARRKVAPLRQVVACLDGSNLGERAIPHAVAIARVMGATLTLLRVLERPFGDPAPADAVEWEFARREARNYVTQLATQFSVESTAIESELIEGRAAEEICRWGADRGVDLTVATTHGEGGPSPWALASTARKLLDRAPGSLLIVPATSAPATATVRYRCLLVPLDGSPQAETALPIAEQLAEAHGAELILAHVVPVPELTRTGPLDAEDVELVNRFRRRNERVASVYLDRLRAWLSADGIRLRALLLQSGDVATRLASLAQVEQVDLIVMAAHGQQPQRDTPCGSATAELIARSTVPLLIVRARPAKATRRVEGPRPSPAPGRLPQLTAL